MANIFKSLILLVIFSFAGTCAWAGGPRLEALGGSDTVTVKRSGKELKLKQGDELEIGDEVLTSRNAAVDIRFEDKTLLRVGANSSYRLEGKPQGFLHKLFFGIVRVLVPPVGEKTSAVRFRLSTPEGTVGVRGTEFVVIAKKGLTTLKGLEGEVLFGPNGADFAKAESFVLVKRGFESSVSVGGKPTAPSAFPLDSYLKDIDGRGSVFGALASRKGTPVKARSTAPESKPKTMVAAAPIKARVKAMAVEKKKEASKELNQADYNEQLFLAAGVGDLDKAKAALKKGADVNTRQLEGNTPLHAAAVESKYEMMKWLLENGADANAKNQNGYTPLMIVALETGDATAAVALLDAGARAGEKDSHDVTALDLAKAGLAKDQKAWQQIYDLLLDESKK